jgi:hypothetical protein
MITISLIFAIYKLLTFRENNEMQTGMTAKFLPVFAGRFSKRRNYSLLFIALVIPSMVFSQKTADDLTTRNIRKNCIDVTVGGSGLFLSTNYSRVLTVQPGYFVNASVGVGTVIMMGGTSVPHQLTFNFGKKSSFLEVGFGGSFWTGKTDSSGFAEKTNSYNISPIIGWRKIFENNMNFRAYVNPLFNVSGEQITNNKFTPYAGISLGYTF